jgi:hypothetical protein
VITATVEDDTSSANFGQVVAVDIAEEGDGYLAWLSRGQWCCDWQLNGIPIVLRRNNPDACSYSHDFCGGWNSVRYDIDSPRLFSTGKQRISVTYPGPLSPPTVRIHGFASSSDDIPGACHSDFWGILAASEPVSNCDSFSFVASSVTGVTATVTAGGNYDSNFNGRHGSIASLDLGNCTACCQGTDDISEEVEAHFYVEGEDCSIDYTAVLVRTTVDPGDDYNAAQFQHGYFGGADGYEVQIEYQHCGVDRYEQDCEQCVKQCRVSATVRQNSGSYLTWYDERLLPDFEYCDLCEDVPVCNVNGRSFNLKRSASPTICNNMRVDLE